MKRNIFSTSALVGALFAGFSGVAMAEITVEKSQGLLSISSDINGTVIAKVIGPDDVVVVDDSYQGNSFNWSPSSGPDGAYRYDVRIITPSTESDNTQARKNEDTTPSDYAGGSVEVRNGAMVVVTEEIK